MTAADQIVRSAKKCLPWGRPHMTTTIPPPIQLSTARLAGSCRKAKILANMIVLPILQAVSVLDFPK